MAFHEASDHFVLFESIPCRVEVIPHGKLSEAEVSDHTSFHNIPPGKRKNCASHNRKSLFYINAMLIYRKRIQSRNLQVIILREHLQQGGIKMRFFIPRMQSIPLICRFANYLNRKQNQRSIRRHIACSIREPAQQTYCQIEAAHTVFLPGCTCSAVEVCKFPVELFFSAKGIEPVAAVFLTEFFIEIEVFSGRPFAYFKYALVLKCLLKPHNRLFLFSVFTPLNANDF